MTGNLPFNPFEERVHLPLVRPKTRGECADVPRPCPFVSCRYHLYLDIVRGQVIPSTDKEPDEMEHSCSLDEADNEEALSYGQIGALVGVSHARAQQIGSDVVDRIKRNLFLAEHAGVAPSRGRRELSECSPGGDATDDEICAALGSAGPSLTLEIARSVGVGRHKAVVALDRLLAAGRVHEGEVWRFGRRWPGWAVVGCDFPPLPAKKGRKERQKTTVDHVASILTALGDGSKTRFEIAAEVGISNGCAKDWLDQMHKSGLVKLRRAGKRTYLWEAAK